MAGHSMRKTSPPIGIPSEEVPNPLPPLPHGTVVPPLPAVIPAAGRSVRMTRPKALLPAAGRSFLATILTTLREGGAAPALVVVNDLAGALAREARAHGGTVILNPDPGPGPISSLQCALRVLPPETPGVLFLPVDHPLVAPGTVLCLLKAFWNHRPALVLPVYGGRSGHPVIFGRELVPELLDPDLPDGARTVVRRHRKRALEVEVNDPGILADIDTPADYERHFPLPTPRSEDVP